MEVHHHEIFKKSPPFASVFSCPARYTVRPMENHKYQHYNIPGDPHGLTFICYKKMRFLKSDYARELLARAIDAASYKHNFAVWAYVIMPEHLHILIYPRNENYSISEILKSIKQPVARQIVNHLKENNSPKLQLLATGTRHHPYRFWQDGGGYDEVIRTYRGLIRFVDYLHENPVVRGFVENAVDWEWSSARDWILGEKGPVEIDLEYFPMR